MSEITEKEFLRRLDSLDEETLMFLSRYAEERRRMAKTSTWISALIASVAGFALTVGSFFPESSKVIVVIISVVLGAAVGTLGIWERKKEEQRLIKRLLRESLHEPSETPYESRKRELIKKFLEAEGL